MGRAAAAAFARGRVTGRGGRDPGRGDSHPLAAPVDRVVLVGFMASGKTTVGRRVAERLGWDFVDVDHVIEVRTGRSVEELFQSRGEAGFREIEAEVTEALLGRTRCVIAPGGGWAAHAGGLDSLDGGVLTVWLDVSPETAVARAGDDDGTRPLLEVDDPVEVARSLAARREAAYGEARMRLDTEGRDPEGLAEEIVSAVRRANEAGAAGREAAGHAES